MEYNWVLSSYTGERAKSVKAHADSGIGYFIQQEGGAGQGHTVVAAFRRGGNEPLEPHMQYCNPAQIIKLEKLYQARHGAVSTRQ